MSTRVRKAALVAPALAILAAPFLGGGLAQAGPPAVPPTVPPAGTTAAANGSPAGSVTLITGDVVTLTAAPGGKFAASVEPGAGRDDLTFHTFEVDGELRVVPADAVAYLGAGTLDIDLFEVSSLLENGYGDDDRDDLPLIVEYSDGVRTTAETPGVTQTHALPSIDGSALSVAHDHTDDLWTTLTARPSGATTARSTQLGGGIERVWLDGKVQASIDESVGQIGAPAAWERGLDGTGVDVAVLDTGVDLNHPDFAGHIATTRDFTDKGNAQDGHGHGTHVAATIAGAGLASAPARRGVAPDARLLVGKVLDDNGSGFESWVIDGMEWATTSGAKVVNLSLGSGPGSDGTDPAALALDRLSEQSGALFVVAAGNDGEDEAIGSPGPASRALTVGAVDRTGALAEFSSRGPRLGDLGIKPEITAPGVGIASARAAGTTMGERIDDFYTRASGTSMATPHVAGAAAILLEQHPDWDGQQVKAALVSSAVPNPNLQPYQQGNGEVRIDRAINEPVIGAGVLNLGLFEERATPQAATIDTDYRNTSDHDVTLKLAVDMTNVRTGRPVGDAVTLEQDTLVVPAGGSATLSLHVDPAKLTRGRHTGYLTAVTPDGATISTALGVVLQPPTYQVTFKGLGMKGQPTPVPAITMFGSGDTPDLMTRIDRGLESLTVDMQADTYILTGLIEHGAPLNEQVTYVVNPEFTVDRDMTIELDARTGNPISIDTPKPSEQQGLLSYYARRVTPGGREIAHGVMHFSTVQAVNVTPTKAVSAGELEFSSRWQLVAPMVTAAIDGQEGNWDINLLHTSPSFDGTRRMRLAYGGSGTARELAGLAGKAVVVDGEPTLDTRAQVAAAAEAGVAALLVVRPPQFSAWTVWNPTGERLALPAMVVANDDGQELLKKAKTGTSTMSLTLQTSSPYLYDVIDVRRGAIPTHIVHEVSAANSARRQVTYADMGGFGWEKEQRFGWRPWQRYAWNDTQRFVRTPMVRTEWISAGDSLWQHRVQHDFSWDSTSPVADGLGGPVQQYMPGTGEESWYSPVIRPAAPDRSDAPVSTRTATQLNFRIPELVDGAGNYGYLGWDGEAHMSVRRDGQLIGESDAGDLDVDTIPDAARYQVVLDTRRSDPEWTSATRTRTDWRFTSEGPASATRAALGMLQVDYRVNEVRASTSGKARLALMLTFRDQRGGRTSVRASSLEMSTDGGVSWETVSSERVSENGFKAMLLVGQAPTVSLRVAAATDDGRELRQTVIDAVRLR